jgi:hypothetical protein
VQNDIYYFAGTPAEVNKQAYFKQLYRTHAHEKRRKGKQGKLPQKPQKPQKPTN